MGKLRSGLDAVKDKVDVFVSGVRRACKRMLIRFRRPHVPSFTSIKWLSSRRIRQEYFTDQFEKDADLFNEAYVDAINQKREEAERQFWKVGLIQITITAFMLLALIKASVTFSIFGISSAEAYKLRDFLLFCQAATVSWSVVLQQYLHKLEDILVAWVKYNTTSEEALPPILLRYLGPIEAFNINVLPYKKNQFHNFATKNIFRLHSILRFFSAMAFASFTLVTPLIVAISVYRQPPNGWFSFASVIYWCIVALFTVTSAAINLFGVPYTDYTYAMKLDALMKSDPASHKRIMAEIARTGKLVEL